MTAQRHRTGCGGGEHRPVNPKKKAVIAARSIENHLDAEVRSLLSVFIKLRRIRFLGRGRADQAEGSVSEPKGRGTGGCWAAKLSRKVSHCHVEKSRLRFWHQGRANPVAEGTSDKECGATETTHPQDARHHFTEKERVGSVVAPEQ